MHLPQYSPDIGCELLILIPYSESVILSQTILGSYKSYPAYERIEPHNCE